VRGDKIPFAQAFDDTTAALMFRLAFPLWSYLPKTFKLRRDLRTIRAFVHDVIGERRAEVARAGSVGTREDVLSRFMSLGHATDQQLHDAAVNFILAGRDTTAQLLTVLLSLVCSRPRQPFFSLIFQWTFYLLATHRDTQTKLLHHIDTLVGDKPLTMDNLKHMDYLQAVMVSRKFVFLFFQQNDFFFKKQQQNNNNQHTGRNIAIVPACAHRF